MKKVRVGINGFGRIGRTLFRIIHDRPDIEVILVNDLYENEQLAYLLKYDTVMGVFPGEVGYDDQYLYANGRKVLMTAERDPSSIPWGRHSVDFVIESTGVWNRRADLEKHLSGGARKVILTVPARDEIDAMIVIGVNEDILEPRHTLVSNASCTTNCLAPIAKILDDFFGIDSGLMTTVHAYTNDQRLADVPHKDLRRSRAAAENIIPTTTGAAKAVGKVLPSLKGKLDGLAMRVPVPDGSVVDLVCRLRSGPTRDDINHAVREAAASPRLTRIVQYTEEALVSTDIVGNSHSSIFDALSTDASGDGWAKVIAWYDNEWGYSNRVVDLLMLPAFQEIPAAVEAAGRRS